jgi:AcrR family transcriptional regulator
MDNLRERVLEGSLACIGRYGMAKTTVDDVARASGVSRASIYRYFPDGKEQLLRETVSWEMGRFFLRLGQAVADSPDLATLVGDALTFAHRAVLSHEVLQKVLLTEPDRLLPLITVESERVLRMIAGFLMPYLERERLEGRLREGVNAVAAADYLARMFLSYSNAPGDWDLDDPAQVADLVRCEFLGAIARP